jgi:hypothetical protein
MINDEYCWAGDHSGGWDCPTCTAVKEREKRRALRTYHVTYEIGKRRDCLSFIARSQERALDALRSIYGAVKLVVLWVEIE